MNHSQTPPILFKYLDSQGGIKTLENMTLRFSTRSSLNDPFEWCYGGVPYGYREKLFQALTRAKSSKEEWIQVCYDWLGHNEKRALDAYERRNAPRFIELVVDQFLQTFPARQDDNHDKNLEMLAITCFSESPSNILMWGHYTGKHSGCVIGFDTAHWNDIHKVRYSSERVPRPMKRGDAQYVALDSLRTKSTEWEYEQEWRFIRKTDTLEEQADGILVQHFSPEIISAIILGYYVDPLLNQTARDFARKHSGCKLLKARRHPDEYRIVIVPYDE